MPHFLRTFVAVELDEPIREAIAGVQRDFRDEGGTYRWVDYRAMHLTLKFLGDVQATAVHEVHRAVEAAVAETAPFALSVRGLGCFGPVDAPHVIWVGIEDGAETLSDMAGAIDREIHDALGMPPEKRPFVPHVTLGRLRTGERRGGRSGQGPRRPPKHRPPRHPTCGRGFEGLAELLARDREREYGRQDVEEVIVFSSELTRTGPIYTPLSRVSLRQ